MHETRTCPPLTIRLNGEPRAIRAGGSVETLLADLRLKPAQVAVEINGQLIPRPLHARQQLEGGDEVEIVTLSGGG